MSRTIRDANLGSREARRRLPCGEKPHWRLVEAGLHLGYRRTKKETPGSWVARLYRLGPDGMMRYRSVPLGLADDYSDADGEHILSFTDAQRLALQARIDHIAATKSRIVTVEDAMRNYIRYLLAEKKCGRHSESVANKLILPYLGHIRIRDLTRRDIEKWRDDRAAEGALLRSPKAKQNRRPAPSTDEEIRARRATINRNLTSLKAALNRAYAEDNTIANPEVWRSVKRFGGVQAARPGFLTVEEAQRLLNAADKTSGFHDLVHAALLTGCRHSELCALKVGDFQHGKLHIRTSKSGKPRVVRLTWEGVEFFEQLCIGRKMDETMLLNFGKPWTPSSQGKPMARACKIAGIVHFSFHGLRHTWASLSIMNGMPLIVVATNLGHKCTKMVEAHYGHLTTGYLDEAIEKAAPRFGFTEPTNVEPLRGRGR